MVIILISLFLQSNTMALGNDQSNEMMLTLKDMTADKFSLDLPLRNPLSSHSEKRVGIEASLQGTDNMSE